LASVMSASCCWHTRDSCLAVSMTPVSPGSWFVDEPSCGHGPTTSARSSEADGDGAEAWRGLPSAVTLMTYMARARSQQDSMACIAVQMVGILIGILLSQCQAHLQGMVHILQSTTLNNMPYIGPMHHLAIQKQWHRQA